MRVDAVSWKASDGESVSRDPTLRHRYTDLCSRLASAGQLEVWVMSLDALPVAAFICPHDGRHRYTLKSSFADGVGGNRSPSLVLLHHIVQTTWGDGTLGIDFVGKVPFLDRWATEDVTFETSVLFRSRMALHRERAADVMRAVVARLRRLPSRLWHRPVAEPVAAASAAAHADSRD